jgi:hypothetical protein
LKSEAIGRPFEDTRDRAARVFGPVGNDRAQRNNVVHGKGSSTACEALATSFAATSLAGERSPFQIGKPMKRPQ